jgi:hypothetical protein
MDADKIINDLYQGALDNRPTFTDEMIEHMKQEVAKMKEDAIKWHQKHKDKVIN